MKSSTFELAHLLVLCLKSTDDNELKHLANNWVHTSSDMFRVVVGDDVEEEYLAVFGQLNGKLINDLRLKLIAMGAEHNDVVLIRL